MQWGQCSCTVSASNYFIQSVTILSVIKYVIYAIYSMLFLHDFCLMCEPKIKGVSVGLKEETVSRWTVGCTQMDLTIGRVRASQHTLKELASEPFKIHTGEQMPSTSNEAAVMYLPPLNPLSALLWGGGGVCWHLCSWTEATEAWLHSPSYTATCVYSMWLGSGSYVIRCYRKQEFSLCWFDFSYLTNMNTLNNQSIQ